MTAGDQATADSGPVAADENATAANDGAVAEHTGESHDDPAATETVPTAASAGGPVSVATEAASTHAGAQEQAELDKAGAEHAIVGTASERHVALAADQAAAPRTPTPAPAPAALIESTQIRRAITQAEKRTDLNWSVFIGTLGEDARAQAEARHAELGPAAAKSVLIAVDPVAHRLEIVTGAQARTVLDDRSCALAAASMTSTFAVRDLDGGIAYGILALVEHVRRTR